MNIPAPILAFTAMVSAASASISGQQYNVIYVGGEDISLNPSNLPAMVISVMDQMSWKFQEFKGTVTGEIYDKYDETKPETENFANHLGNFYDLVRAFKYLPPQVGYLIEPRLTLDGVQSADLLSPAYTDSQTRVIIGRFVCEFGLDQS